MSKSVVVYISLWLKQLCPHPVTCRNCSAAFDSLRSACLARSAQRLQPRSIKENQKYTFCTFVRKVAADDLCVLHLMRPC